MVSVKPVVSRDSTRRLEARPTATLCIDGAKLWQEIKEKAK